MRSQTPADDLPHIGNPARRALAEIGVTTMSQVSMLGKSELRRLHGVGPKAIAILEQALGDRGQTFREPEA